MLLKKRNLTIFFIFFISIIYPPFAHAYAGPGVALAAIIVFITVIFAFFASTFLSFFKLVKKFFSWLKYQFSSRKKFTKGNKNKPFKN